MIRRHFDGNNAVIPAPDRVEDRGDGEVYRPANKI